MRSHLYLGAIFALFSLAVYFSSKSVETTVQHNDEWSPIVGTFHRMEMVFVPAGCFRMGDTSNAVEQCIEQPFWIGRFEVNVTQFNAFFRKAGVGYNGYRRDSMLPVDRATWFGAHDFCADYGMRLPSFVELEFASAGPDNRLSKYGQWVDVLGLVALSEWTGSLEWDDTDNLEDDASSQRLLGGYGDFMSYFSSPDAANFGFRCAYSPYDTDKWQPRLYSGYVSPKLPPVATDYTGE